MANINYLVVSGEGETFKIDGVCGTKENAERICAVFNDRANQGGKCFAERRVMTVNNYDGPLDDGGAKIVRRVSVRVKCGGKGGSTVIGGVIVCGYERGICYSDNGKRKDIVIPYDKNTYLVELFTDSEDPGAIIQAAMDAVRETVAN